MYRPDNEYICDECKQPVRCEFHVAGHLWHNVVKCTEPISLDGYDGGEGYLCLICFAIRTAQAGVTEFMVNHITV